MRHTPPKYALSFLRWFCREDYLEELEGDLNEVFQKEYRQSPAKARYKFALNTLRYFRPGFIKSFSSINSIMMYKSYFTISWRNLIRQKMYSIIKIGGLALGIAACLLIGLFLKDELSYDEHFPSNVYRVVAAINDDGKTFKEAAFPAPMASSLKNDFIEITNAGRYNSNELHGAGSAQIRRAERLENNYEQNIAFVDQSLLEMLSVPMVYGSEKHALKDPNTIVITKTKALKYFPEEDPIGKLLVVNNDDSHPYKIGGVIEDFPSNSHIHFDFLITLTGKELWPGEQTTWMASNYPTYISLKEGTDPKVLADKIFKGIIEKYYLPAMLAQGNVSEKQAREMFAKATLELQPVKDIYLDSAVRDRLPHSDMRFIWLFATVAAFILVIACINFVNLSTARSANRAKEVGVRKVMGSFRSNIINQFMTESFLFTFLSFIAGITLAALLLPYFNFLANKSISFPWYDWNVFLMIGVALIAIALIAGTYPAFYLSSFKPVNVLKGNVSLGSKSSGTRSMLVVFQFATSTVLIVSTFVIYRQMDFILNKKIGFNKEQVLLVEGANSLENNVHVFKNSLLKLPQIKYVSVSDYLPVSNMKRNGNTFWNESQVKGYPGVIGQIWQVDHDYITTMGMHLVKGRDFNQDITSDSTGAIINERMAKQLGLTEPLGQRITNGRENFQVIGVIEDFHFESVKQTITPLCLVLGNSSGVISVKASTEDMAGTIKAVEQAWKQFAPNQPFRYNFLDERYASMYDDVSRMGKIFTCAAVFAVIVACLGLFGLSSFMVEQRSKEISIRLMLGASMNSIFTLLTRNFMMLVAISFIIAAPLGWYAMQLWLQDYTYRINVSWDIFMIAGILSLTIALFTVSYQSLRAATTKPLDKLKSS